MFEILVPVVIFAGILFSSGPPVLTNYNYFRVASANMIISAVVLGFEVLNYFYPDRFRIFWTRFYKSYREIFAKTVELYFERLQKICIAATGAFIAVQLLLVYYHFAIRLEYTLLIVLTIGALYQISLFAYASPEERQEYFNFLKEEYTTFSKSGLSWMAGIFIVGALWLYNLQYGDEGTFCFVDAENYESVMKGSLEKITSVKVRKNSLTEQQIIAVLKKCDPEKLQNLELAEVKLSDDFWETAKKFRKLTRLDFWDVDISKLPESFAESFPCMETLYIHDSKNLKEFPNGIEKLQELQWVSLTGCGLRKLPKNIGELNKLKKLSLAENPLESVDDICSLRNLIMLDVGGCKLKSLPQNIVNLKNLEELNISDNEFIEFPKQVRGLTALVRLDANGLNLKKVPQEIFELKNLSNLSLSRNQLESLPNEISNLKDLTHLYLGENKFKTVPPQLLKISRLRSLSLKGNQLSELPPEMEGLITKLSWFDIGHNKFRTRPMLLLKFRGERYCLMEDNNPYNQKKKNEDEK